MLLCVGIIVMVLEVVIGLLSVVTVVIFLRINGRNIRALDGSVNRSERKKLRFFTECSGCY